MPARPFSVNSARTAAFVGCLAALSARAQECGVSTQEKFGFLPTTSLFAAGTADAGAYLFSVAAAGQASPADLAPANVGQCAGYATCTTCASVYGERPNLLLHY